MRQALDAGVKCIEHGQLLDEATAKLMAEKGVWWSLQPFTDDRPSAYPEVSAIHQDSIPLIAINVQVPANWRCSTKIGSSFVVVAGALMGFAGVLTSLGLYVAVAPFIDWDSRPFVPMVLVGLAIGIIIACKQQF